MLWLPDLDSAAWSFRDSLITDVAGTYLAAEANPHRFSITFESTNVVQFGIRPGQEDATQKINFVMNGLGDGHNFNIWQHGHLPRMRWTIQASTADFQCYVVEVFYNPNWRICQDANLH